MTTVAELIPGDLVTGGGASAVFVAATAHPIWPHLRLVIWRLYDPAHPDLQWSHDALWPLQVVGSVVLPVKPGLREQRLRTALLGAAS